MKIIEDRVSDMFSKKKRKETKTIEKMIGIFCSGLHKTDAGLCPKCEGLLSYALQRIHHSPLKENKTTCAKCTIHCYKPEMRKKIRDVMRYAGPRMTYKHPFLTIYHLFVGVSVRVPVPPESMAVLSGSMERFRYSSVNPALRP